MDHDKHVKIFNQIKSQTSSAFSQGGGAPPHIIAIRKDGKDFSVFFIAEMDDHNDKDKVAAIMIQLIRDGVDAICFVCEAWTLEGKGKSLEEIKNLGPISNNPNRVEVLLLNYSWSDGAILGTAPIVKQKYDPWDEDAEIPNSKLNATLGEWRVIDSVEREEFNEGRFSNLWKKAYSDDVEPISLKCYNIKKEEEEIQEKEIQSFKELWDDIDS